MDSSLLFTSALGLQSPWPVTEIRFEPDQREFNLILRVMPNAWVALPAAGQFHDDDDGSLLQHEEVGIFSKCGSGDGLLAPGFCQIADKSGDEVDFRAE